MSPKGGWGLKQRLAKFMSELASMRDSGPCYFQGKKFFQGPNSCEIIGSLLCSLPFCQTIFWGRRAPFNQSPLPLPLWHPPSVNFLWQTYLLHWCWTWMRVVGYAPNGLTWGFWQRRKNFPSARPGVVSCFGCVYLWSQVFLTERGRKRAFPTIKSIQRINQCHILRNQKFTRLIKIWPTGFCLLQCLYF